LGGKFEEDGKVHFESNLKEIFKTYKPLGHYFFFTATVGRCNCQQSLLFSSFGSINTL
jgi:hypothetical protein